MILSAILFYLSNIDGDKQVENDKMRHHESAANAKPEKFDNK
jgi:hypothetical protein